MRKKNQLYGNENGLPGLPKSSYITVGGRRVQPPRTQMRAQQAPQQLNRQQLQPTRQLATRQQPLTRPAPITISGPDPTLSRRIDSLDHRIVSTEQSNRTLLDELMRLQKEINVSVRRNEIGIQEERDSRSRLEMNIRQSQGKNYETDDRIKRVEDSTKDNRGAVQQVSLHVNNIEKMVNSLQQDQIEKKSENSNKLQEYRNEVARLTSDNDQLQRVVNNLREEARDNSSRIDNMSSEVTTLSNNLRLQSRLMEENARRPPPKTPGADKKLHDNDRANMEAKIMQLNSAIQDISNRLTDEGKNRDRIEQDLSSKISGVTSEYSSSKAKNDKAQEQYDEKMKDMTMGFAETDKQAIKVEISKVANELNSKIDKNERNLRKDTVEKLDIIERTIVEENKKNAENADKLKEEVEGHIENIKDQGKNGNTDLQSAFDKQVKQNKENLNELNKRMNDVEKQFRNHKLEQEKVLHVEIDERLEVDEILDAKIEDLDDDVRLGFAKLQDDFGKVSSTAAAAGSTRRNTKTPKTPAGRGGPDYDEVNRLQEEKADGIRKQVAEDMGELRSRISKLETEIKQKEDIINNRLETSKVEDQESATLQIDQLQQQIDALVLKNNRVKRQLDDLETQVEDTPKNLQAYKEENNEKISTINKELSREKKERKETDDEIKEDVDKIIGKRDQGNLPSLAQLNMDVDQTQTGLKKCAESIHVVKTMLTDRLKDERKVREKETTILNSDVDRLETKIKELKSTIKYGTGSSGQDDGDNYDEDEDFL